jgi:hypothetical protein
MLMNSPDSEFQRISFQKRPCIHQMANAGNIGYPETAPLPLFATTAALGRIGEGRNLYWAGHA